MILHVLTYNDGIHIDSRNFNKLRVKAAVFHNLFNLYNHFAAAVSDSLGNGSGFQGRHLVLHCDIAVFIGISTAYEGDVDGEGLVKQFLLTQNTDHLD